MQHISELEQLLVREIEYAIAHVLLCQVVSRSVQLNWEEGARDFATQKIYLVECNLAQLVVVGAVLDLITQLLLLRGLHRVLQLDESAYELVHIHFLAVTAYAHVRSQLLVQLRLGALHCHEVDVVEIAEDIAGDTCRKVTVRRRHQLVVYT